MERGTKKMKFKKAVGDSEVLKDILKLLGEGGIKFIVQLINNMQYSYMKLLSVQRISFELQLLP